MFTKASVFSHHMVLQRDKAIPIWGTARPGAEICVTLDGYTTTSTADKNGNWFLSLRARGAGGPYTLRMQSEGSVLQCEDVYIGEVWLAGGQSNMEMALQDCKNGKREVADSQHPNIRFYNVPQCATADEQQAQWETQSSWQVCSPETSAHMSAVAYFFARQLAETQGVAIGIIDCYWGGTSISCWMSRAQLERTRAGQEYLTRYAALVGDKTEEQYAAEMAAYNAKYQAWCARVEARREENPDIRWVALNAECGVCPWPQPAGKDSPFRPAGLYETMLRRVCPYGLRGFLYYQGEEDIEHYATYADMMIYLIDQWRTDWQDDRLPFLFVQLPMYCSREEYEAHQDSKQLALLRDQQMKVCRTVAKTGLAVLTDCGEFDNIHPLDKQTVGFRLALQARKKVYGDEVAADAPVFARAESNGKKMQVWFRHTEGCLNVRGDMLEGFELADDNGVFYPARGNVTADYVTLECDAVPIPRYVRYAWTNFGLANLYGASGLPAAPFRTDTFPVEGLQGNHGLH